MSKYRTLVRGDVFPASFVAALQEFVSSQASSLQINKTSTTTVQVPAGAGDAQVSLGIGGLWRYNTANVSATHPGGAAGSYDLLAVASANNFSNSPAPDTDNTDYSFGVQIVVAAASPTGTWNGNAISNWRKIGTVRWDGAKIVGIDQVAHSRPGASWTGPYMPFAPLQQGVLTGSWSSGVEGYTNWVSTSSVSVNSAWLIIADANDSLTVLNQLVPAYIPATTTIAGIPAAATNPRTDQILALAPSVPGGIPQIVRVQGAETAGATLDTRGGAVIDATLNTTYPQGWMRLSDVLVGTTGVVNANSIRVRSTYARGARFVGSFTSSIGAGSATSTTNVEIYPSILNARVEANGRSIFRASLYPVLQKIGTVNPIFYIRLFRTVSSTSSLGTNNPAGCLREWGFDYTKDSMEMGCVEFADVPAAGSWVYRWAFALNQTADTLSTSPYTNGGAMGSCLEEIVDGTNLPSYNPLA